MARYSDGQSILLEAPQISSAAIEPIEKKPLYHYKPNLRTLSFGGYGCNMSCDFCLPGDTLISTPTGLKRIDQIQDGDAVYAFDNSTGVQRLVEARVGHVFGREAQEVIELEVDGETIQLTPEHPVMTRDGWKEAQHLDLEDEILCVRDK